MREFWLTEHKEHDFWYAHDSEQYDDDVHVIEKSAFDSLLKDAQGLVEALKRISNYHDYDCDIELYGCSCVQIKVAQQALQSFQKKWGGE